MASLPQDPSHIDIQTQTADSARASVPVAEPGVVLSYDRATGRATVAPVLQYTYRDVAGVGRRTQAPVVDVPVVWPMTSSGALTMDLSPGDRVWLVVGGRSLDEWKATDAANIQQQDLRRHNLSDAVAFPVSIAAYDAATYAPGATVLSGADVRLGSALAVSPVALAVPTDANFTALRTLFAALAAAPDWAAAVVILTTFLATDFPTPTSSTTTKAL